jgi:beta-lactamase class A
MDGALEQRIREIGAAAPVSAIAVAVHDFATGADESVDGDRWFHAASTIKVAILLAVAAGLDDGRFQVSSRLAIRNRFLSTADGEPYRVPSSRDSNAVVHANIGKTMVVEDLARHMIVTSSNLAANLLLDLVTVERARALLGRLGIEGVELRRGVEDDRAFAAGINNRVTARGLVALFRAIHEGRAVSPARTAWMMEILADQQFAAGIPAGIPEHVRGAARVAHKTGEISTAAHDTGLVTLPGGTTYALAVLTEYEPGASPQQRVIADVSRAVYEHVVMAMPA